MEPFSGDPKGRLSEGGAPPPQPPARVPSLEPSVPRAFPGAAAAAEGETEAAPPARGGGFTSAPSWHCTNQLAGPSGHGGPEMLFCCVLGLGEEEDVVGSCQG